MATSNFKIYSQDKFFFRTYQLFENIFGLKQDEKLFSEYYRTLKAMSEELNINRPVTSSLEDSKRPSLRVFGC